MARDTSQAETCDGVLDERRSSPGLLLALIGQYAMRQLREVHTAHDLNPRQFQLLGLLHSRGALGQGELGQSMEVDPSILVTLLNPLEADGLVLRERDPADRRCHVVTLTSAGERSLDRAADAQRLAEDVLFAGLDADQRDELRVLLIALRDSLARGPEQACTEAVEDC